MTACDTAIDASVLPSSAIHGQALELCARCDHRRHAFFTLKVDPSVGEHRRRGVVAAQALLPADLAGLRVRQVTARPCR